MPKKPFSGKAKKAQLLAKREKNSGKSGVFYRATQNVEENQKAYEKYTEVDLKVDKTGRNRYKLNFKTETKEEIRLNRERSLQPLPETKQPLTASTPQFFHQHHDFPTRPPWREGWSRERLEMNEQKMFREYVNRVLDQDSGELDSSQEAGGSRAGAGQEAGGCRAVAGQEAGGSRAGAGHEAGGSRAGAGQEAGGSREGAGQEAGGSRPDAVQEAGGCSAATGHFELNLETWRQLWRVLEKSDILLLILDVRYAAATFPPSLYHYITAKGKQMILVLNKVDLIPPSLAAAWRSYFTGSYPSLHVIYFTSFPAYTLVGSPHKNKGLKNRKKKGTFVVAREGSREIWEICRKIYGGKIELNTWKQKIEGGGGGEVGVEEIEGGSFNTKDQDMTEEGVLTLGTVGHPNVGKSSLINSLCGRKVVSVSRTPGHTKHFQTIYLTRTVKLVDCPGLVFPSSVPKPLQVLMGSFPISQVREPYSVVMYLAERTDLPALLNIQLGEDASEWSAFLICEMWALKRGYLTARTSRPDTFRAANNILRLALDGRICLSLEPPDYSETDWTNHPDATLADQVTARIREAAGSAQYSPGLSHQQSSGDDEDDSDNESEDEDIEEGGGGGGGGGSGVGGGGGSGSGVGGMDIDSESGDSDPTVVASTNKMVASTNKMVASTNKMVASTNMFALLSDQ